MTSGPRSMANQQRPYGRFSETYPAERRTIRLDDWPEQDRLAFERARKVGSAFELAGPAASWTPATCHLRRQAYGRYLNFLNRNGLLLPSEGPADRMTPDRLSLYLPEMRLLLSAQTIAKSLIELRLLLAAMVPESDWRWIRRHPGIPSIHEIRAGSKAKATFNPLALCSQALDLLDHIAGSPFSNELRIQYRDALIVAFQCIFALRRRNLIEMSLGRNLILGDDVIHLIFKAAETKNHSPIRCTTPEFLAPYLTRYLNNVRPALLAGNRSDAVWINFRHQALEYGACPYLFHSIGMRLLGYPITCHTFRRSAATTILTKDPRKIRVAAGVLMHDGLRTVNQHYDLSGEAGSRRVWAKLRRDIVRGKGLHQP